MTAWDSATPRDNGATANAARNGSPACTTAGRRSRPQRWRDAVQTLVDLQAEYQDWLDNLPDSLQGSAVAEKLASICEYDFGDLEALEPPRGFGRD